MKLSSAFVWIAIVMLTTAHAVADGFLSYKQPFLSTTGLYAPQIELEVSEPITKGWSDELYVGWRIQQWAQFTNFLMMPAFGRLQLGIGPYSFWAPGTPAEFGGMAQIRVKLW